MFYRDKTRYVFCAAFFCCLSTSLACADSLWDEYKKRFLSADGRVIDYYNNSVSHSEGQGYCMVLALANGDLRTFELCATWTQNNLKGREDGLHPWQWGKRESGDWNVIDHTNATDGDILIAWAYAKGAQVLKKPAYLEKAKAIIAAMRRLLVTEFQGKKYLLPAYYGFVEKGSVVLNPSYLLLPAYKRFAAIDQKHIWERLHADALDILRRGRFGSYKLPPDWLKLETGGLRIHGEKSTRFGYDAIRVPLNVEVKELPELFANLGKVMAMQGKLGYLPSWVDLASDATALSDAPAGFYGVYAQVAKKLGNAKESARLYNLGVAKLKGEGDSYYSYSLFLLARVDLSAF